MCVCVSVSLSLSLSVGVCVCVCRYDAQHEAMRKEQLRLLMGRSIGQIHEENMLKADLKKIKAQDAQLERRASVPKRDAEDASGNPNKKLKKKTAPQGKHSDSAATRMYELLTRRHLL